MMYIINMGIQKSNCIYKTKQKQTNKQTNNQPNEQTNKQTNKQNKTKTKQCKQDRGNAMIKYILE